MVDNQGLPQGKAMHLTLMLWLSFSYSKHQSRTTEVKVVTNQPASFHMDGFFGYFSTLSTYSGMWKHNLSSHVGKFV